MRQPLAIIPFQPGRTFSAEGFIAQIQQGEYRTIWPSDIAASLVIWPIPKYPAPEAQP